MVRSVPVMPYIERMSAPALFTAEDLEQLTLPDKRVELVRGQLVVREPAGYRHGAVAMQLGAAMHRHAESRGLGRVFAAETGFTIGRTPDTVRAPDVAFVSAERLPVPAPRGFAELAPDLAVEVLSPDDRAGDVLEKVADWLNAGTRLVWVIDPVRVSAMVYRADGTAVMVERDGALHGEDVLPGFTWDLARAEG